MAGAKLLFQRISFYQVVHNVFYCEVFIQNTLRNKFFHMKVDPMPRFFLDILFRCPGSKVMRAGTSQRSQVIFQQNQNDGSRIFIVHDIFNSFTNNHMIAAEPLHCRFLHVGTFSCSGARGLHTLPNAAP